VSAMYDMLARLQRGEAPRPPVAELVGFDLVALDKGAVTVTFEAKQEHANPMGTLHGGILCDVADAAMGMAYASTLEDGESFTTLELKINFFRPVWRAHLTARGRVVNQGKTVGMVECDIFDEKQRHVARATSTCLTLRDEMAKGR
jgi:uncharacterized protein (TIGR00369 family)